MGRTQAPIRVSSLLSKSFLRRQLRQATKATRITDEALVQFELAVSNLADLLVECVQESYAAQVGARRAQTPGNAVMPHIMSRHVLGGLKGLPKFLESRLASRNDETDVADWTGVVNTEDGSPETA